MSPAPPLACLMNIDPIRRQNLISPGSNLILTFVGFVAPLYFAHAVGAAAYGSFPSSFPTTAFST